MGDRASQAANVLNMVEFFKYLRGLRSKRQGGVPEGQSDERITVQRRKGVPAQDLGGGGTVGSDWDGNLEGPAS